LDHLLLLLLQIPTCRYELWCRICIPVVQIQPRKHVLDRAGFKAPTRQHELDPTDREPICPERSLDHAAGIDDLSDVCHVAMLSYRIAMPGVFSVEDDERGERSSG
ncbi:unnamed protein product, partial [Laminaria digitata]